MTHLLPEQSREELDKKTRNHPCYSGGCQNARMHLPVAPACNISCNYCSRKYDCVNESRPGVTSEVLSPEQAINKYIDVKNRIKNLKVVGIAGPGDALANFEATRKTLELIREADPEITFCLSTNGLMLPAYAADLHKLGVTHVTITINTIDPKIGAQIYREVNYNGERLTGEEGAAVLLKNQLEGLRLLISLGIVVKINVVMIKGINDMHIEDVIKKVKDMGVFISNIMPLIPAPGSAFEHIPLSSNIELNSLRKLCEKHLKQMYHCRQCRADAIGTLDNDCSVDFRSNVKETSIKAAEASDNKTYTVAVASHSGRLIDQHFGHANEFRIYSYKAGSVELIEKRQIKQFCTGVEDCDDEHSKLENITKIIEDCNAVLVLRIGHLPKTLLEQKGINVIQTFGFIDEEIKKYVLEQL